MRPHEAAERVLVVASPDLALLLAGLLGGETVLQELLPEQAAARARQEAVALIIATDDVDAADLRRRLAEDPRTAATPVLELGVSIDAPALLAEVARLCQR